MKLPILKHAILVFALGLSVTMLWPQRAANSQTAPQAEKTPEKTIDQTHKDIQVLKGLPDSQLTHIMNYFNAALGVQCTFCHVRENNAMAFDKDHEHKTIAREMIKMVQGVNKNEFKGRNAVSCYTCHQGRAVPLATPAFPLPAPMAGAPRPAGAAPGTPPTATAPAPTAESVWDKYVAAVGGKDAIAKLKNRVVKGTFDMGGGRVMDLVITTEAGKIHSALKSQQGEMAGAFNGSTGWTKSPRGTGEMNRNDMANAKALLENLEVLKLGEPYPKLNLSRRRARIGDRDALILTGSREGKSLTLFFDAETGLLLRKSETNPTLVGSIPEQVDFEDYQTVDGVKLPMTIKTYSVIGQATGVRKLTEVKHNVSLDGALFSAPK